MGAGARQPGQYQPYQQPANNVQGGVNQQVYYDNGGYFTQTPLSMMNPVSAKKRYTSPMEAQPQQPSIINDLIQQAMNAQANAPTMGQLFPGSLGGLLGNGGYTAQGQYGAGRFLGSPIMGNPSLTATQSTNTTT